MNALNSAVRTLISVSARMSEFALKHAEAGTPSKAMWAVEAQADISRVIEVLARASRSHDALAKALKVAVIQNQFDMLMTGEEIRQCEAAIEKAGAA